MNGSELKQQLIDMVEEDQRVRAELAATGELYQGYAPRMAEVHTRNAQRLEAGETPPDYETRQVELRTWSRSVGWL